LRKIEPEFATAETLVISNDTQAILVEAFYQNAHLKTVIFEDNSQLAVIEDLAFAGCSNLKSIAIPHHVTKIGDYAFAECPNLENIVIPHRVTEIGDFAFNRDPLLKTLRIPPSVQTIGAHAFDMCELNEVIFEKGSSLTHLGVGSFAHTAFTSITLPEKVIALDPSVFSDSALQHIIITAPQGIGLLDSLKDVPSLKFASFSDNSIFEKIDGVWTPIEVVVYPDNDTITQQKDDPRKTARAIIIGKGVTEISPEAFAGCANLAVIQFEEGSQLTTIGEFAFAGCANLVAIQFGEGSQLTTIEKSAFANCANLVEIQFGEGSKLTTIGESAFADCTNLVAIQFGKGSQLTTIKESAFIGCKSLKAVHIPAYVTTIGKDSFSGCGLGNITFAAGAPAEGPKVVRLTIGDMAFESNPVENLTIPSRIQTIGSRAFYDCKKLKKIVIEGNDVEIGKAAFGTISLPDIQFGPTLQPGAAIAFKNFQNDIKAMSVFLTRVMVGTQACQVSFNGILPFTLAKRKWTKVG
jgi:hypothetical protein